MDLRMRVPHIVRVTTKGRTYFYHRKTRERLPDDEEARVLRAIQINGEKNFVRVIREKKPTGSITGYVYLVINKATGKLKIGYSKNPWRRIEDMQVANDGALRLIAVMAGSRHTERRLHGMLKSHKIRGEWFHPDPAISEYFGTLMGETVAKMLRREVTPSL